MRICLLLLSLVIAISQSGCILMEPAREISSSMMRTFRPNSGDYRDSIEEPTGEWKDVGIIARGDRPAQKADPIRRFMLSPKAREIEANLGIVD